MPSILIRLSVEDYGRWKPVFDDYAGVRQASGSHGGRLFRGADKPNEIYILWQWESIDSGRQFFQSQDLRETMQRAGVTGRPEVYYLDEVEHLAV